MFIYIIVSFYFMGKPLTKRAKIRHLQEGSEKYLMKASVGARIAAVAKGQRAILKWHQKVGTDLDRLKNTLKENKKNLIEGYIKPRGWQTFKGIDNITSSSQRLDGYNVSELVPGFSIVGSVLGLGAGGLFGRSFGAATVGGVIGVAIVNAPLALMFATAYYDNMRAEFLRLRKMLKKERLVVARKGKILSAEAKSHNEWVVGKIEARIDRLLEANEKQKKKVEAFLEE